MQKSSIFLKLYIPVDDLDDRLRVDEKHVLVVLARQRSGVLVDQTPDSGPWELRHHGSDVGCVAGHLAPDVLV